MKEIKSKHQFNRLFKVKIRILDNLVSHFKKYGEKYPHTRENARRRRQIELGILTVSNGLEA